MEKIDCRHSFEEWFFDGKVPENARDREGYRLMSAQSAWCAWFASWNLAIQQGNKNQLVRALKTVPDPKDYDCSGSFIKDHTDWIDKTAKPALAKAGAV